MGGRLMSAYRIRRPNDLWPNVYYPDGQYFKVSRDKRTEISRALLAERDIVAYSPRWVKMSALSRWRVRFDDCDWLVIGPYELFAYDAIAVMRDTWGNRWFVFKRRLQWKWVRMQVRIIRFLFGSPHLWAKNEGTTEPLELPNWRHLRVVRWWQGR